MSELFNNLGQPIGAPLPEWHARPLPARTVLTGHACHVEPLDPARHGSDLFKAYQADREGRLWTYMGYGPFATQQDFMRWLETAAAGSDPLFFAVVDNEDDAAKGVASYLRMEPAVGVIEVGHIHFSRSLQGTTMATEAMYLMMAHVFDTLGYRRYEWKCDALNEHSRKAAQRLGFTYEGLFRQATIYKGRNRDTAWYSIIDGEWPALKRAYQAWLAPDNFDADGKQRKQLAVFIKDERD